ncbi:MAG: TIGR01212 family radical SAM protein [Mogibacterium sp.]|nr:TIGR01212 family radical SAM protein [Mogibacterium sp.]
MQNGERYNSISSYLKEIFGRKTVKLSLDAGMTCPNRDGTLGTGGCAFCSSTGSGEFSSTIGDQIALLSRKWPDACYLAYFQNHTNTYAPVPRLRALYEEALSDARISGLAIATRPDCLEPEVLDLLEEMNRRTFLWVELGLQTIHARTSEAMGIGYSVGVYDRAVRSLQERGIRVVVHVILGLPGETREMMAETVRHVASQHVFGIKLHMLNVIRSSRLYERMPDYCPFESIDQYTDLVCDLLRIIPPDITIHRLTADAERSQLVAPAWSYKKRTILNEINRKLRERDIRQGDLLCPGNSE